MAVSALPALIDALVAAATSALPAVVVCDGLPVAGDPGDYLLVGVDDPDTSTFAVAADTAQTPATLGTARSRDEEGDLFCVAESWNGAADAKAARDAAYATAEAVALLVRQRTTPPFGVASLVTVEFAQGSQQLEQGQFDRGAVARVHFTIHFRARL